MKKAELEKLVVGSIVRHRSNNKEYQIVEITEYDMTIKCLTEEDSRISTFNTLKRWYDVVEYEPQQVEVPDVPNMLVISEQLLLPAPQQMLLLNAPKKQRKQRKASKKDKKVIEKALQQGSILVTDITTIAAEAGCTITECKSYRGLKYNGKNIIEIHKAKRYINLVISEECYTEEERMLLDDARIVYNKSHKLRLKFKLNNVQQFKDILERAIEVM